MTLRSLPPFPETFDPSAALEPIHRALHAYAQGKPAGDVYAEEGGFEVRGYESDLVKTLNEVGGLSHDSDGACVLEVGLAIAFLIGEEQGRREMAAAQEGNVYGTRTTTEAEHRARFERCRGGGLDLTRRGGCPKCMAVFAPSLPGGPPLTKVPEHCRRLWASAAYVGRSADLHHDSLLAAAMHMGYLEEQVIDMLSARNRVQQRELLRLSELHGRPLIVGSTVGDRMLALDSCGCPSYARAHGAQCKDHHPVGTPKARTAERLFATAEDLNRVLSRDVIAGLADPKAVEQAIARATKDVWGGGEPQGKAVPVATVTTAEPPRLEGEIARGVGSPMPVPFAVTRGYQSDGLHAWEWYGADDKPAEWHLIQRAEHRALIFGRCLEQAIAGKA